MRRTRVPALVLAVLLAAACTAEVRGVASPGSPVSSPAAPPSTDGPSPSPTPEQEPMPYPADEQPPDGPSFPADTGDDSGPAEPGTGEPVGATRVDGLRLASRDGYTRLVVDLDGAGVPEWRVGYSDATGPGGGPVEISGAAFLRVQLRTEAPPGGQSTSRIRTSPGPILEALTTGAFEGYEEILLGIDGGEQPFRAFALTDPGRIVIDVRYG